jgi:hypothetical protein
MKRGSVALIALLGLSGSMAASPEAADSSFLCENNFRVRLGQHVSQVIWSCGDPDWASQRIEKHKTRYKIGRRCSCHDQEITEERITEILVDDLVYDFGLNRKARYLRFENGFLTSIYSRWIPASR